MTDVSTSSTMDMWVRPQGGHATMDMLVKRRGAARSATMDMHVSGARRATMSMYVSDARGTYRGIGSEEDRDALEAVVEYDTFHVVRPDQKTTSEMWDGTQWVPADKLATPEGGQQRAQKVPTIGGWYSSMGNKDFPFEYGNDEERRFYVNKSGKVVSEGLILPTSFYEQPEIIQHASFAWNSSQVDPNDVYNILPDPVTPGNTIIYVISLHGAGPWSSGFGFNGFYMPWQVATEDPWVVWKLGEGDIDYDAPVFSFEPNIGFVKPELVEFVIMEVSNLHPVVVGGAGVDTRDGDASLIATTGDAGSTFLGKTHTWGIAAFASEDAQYMEDPTQGELLDNVANAPGGLAVVTKTFKRSQTSEDLKFDITQSAESKYVSALVLWETKNQDPTGFTTPDPEGTLLYARRADGAGPIESQVWEGAPNDPYPLYAGTPRTDPIWIDLSSLTDAHTVYTFMEPPQWKTGTTITWDIWGKLGTKASGHGWIQFECAFGGQFWNDHDTTFLPNGVIFIPNGEGGSTLLSEIAFHLQGIAVARFVADEWWTGGADQLWIQQQVDIEWPAGHKTYLSPATDGGGLIDSYIIMSSIFEGPPWLGLTQNWQTHHANNTISYEAGFMTLERA